MKYFKNNKSYALAFRKGDGVNGELFEFDCLRVYTDTGNIATTGITAIEDEDFELLKKNKAFAQMFEKKGSGLSLVDESQVTGEVDKRASELAEENKELKRQLAEAKKQAEGNEDVEAVQKIKDENAKLKAQLENLTKGKKDKADKGADENKPEDEGF